MKPTPIEHITSKDGTSIGYKRSGSDSPLLLVHGATADHRRWEAISPRFEQHFTVYAMDRRGRGSSGDSPEYEFMREAEDVASLAEAASTQQGEPAAALGHSFGALCSLEAALLTEKLGRLVLYEPPFPGVAPPIPAGVIDKMQALLERGEQEAALEVFMREVVRMPEHELASYRQLPMWQGRIQIIPTVPRELNIDRTYHFDAGKFAALQVPTLLLEGGDSPQFAKQAVEMVSAALPYSQVVSLPGQQHIAMDTNPDLFAREVLEFLLA